MAKKANEIAEEVKYLSAREAINSVVDLNKIMDENAKLANIHMTQLSSTGFMQGAVSTGVLSLDLATGGGNAPGRVVYFYGPEHSCKSTVVYQSFKAAMDRDIPAVLMDHEGVDPSYFVKLGIEVSRIMGMQNKQGKWLEDPRFRYYEGETAESTLGFIANTLAKLPDKIIMRDGDKDRFFVIAPDFQYKPNWPYINEGLKLKKIVEVEDFAPQMLWSIDSVAAMIPQSLDEEDGLESNVPALHARAISRGLQRLKSALVRKNCTLVLTNQLRVNPMARFVNPETEPGGNALRYYIDTKIRLSVSRTQKNTVIEEHHTGDGSDRYFPGTAAIQKNKRGPGFRDIGYRVWNDEQGQWGRGICPVYDIFNFLEKTNQLHPLEGRKKEFKIGLSGFDDTVFNWTTFKKFVLGSPDESGKLKKLLQAQLRVGKAQELYAEHLKDEGFKKKESSKAETDAASVDEATFLGDTGDGESKVVDI